MANAKFIIERDTSGNVDLRGTGVTKLPDNLTVGGHLDLKGTGVTKLRGRCRRDKLVST